MSDLLMKELVAGYSRGYSEIEKKCAKLEYLSGLSIDELIDKFEKGYEITPPKNTNTLEQLAKCSIIKDVFTYCTDKSEVEE